MSASSRCTSERHETLLPDATHHVLSAEECHSIAQRIGRLTRGTGDTTVMILSWWNGELRWARNTVRLASDRQSRLVFVRRVIRGVSASAVTNQVDDVSLDSALREAERNAVFGLAGIEDLAVPHPPYEYPRTTIWSESTYELTADQRGHIARTVIAPATTKGMLSAGYLEARAQAGAMVRYSGTTPNILYATATQAQCSMTVRSPDGTGSGWAGLSSYDWNRIDGTALANRAVEKCRISQNPVRIEPGRYTVILEPQAVHDWVTLMMDALVREPAERAGMGPFVVDYDTSLQLWRTKLGLPIVDSRITIGHDPGDPELGVLPVSLTSGVHEPFQPVTWIDRGVLNALSDQRPWALVTRNDHFGKQYSGAFRMSGGATTIEEMIQGTERGLYVTRFSNLAVLDWHNLLTTGLTRDGLWLIERGKISKSVWNMRVSESPLFVLNQVEQLGVSVPVFRPVEQPYMPGITPAIVPAIKARDFSYTATIDAV